MNFLETDRLILRNLELEDAESMYDYRNKEICNKYQRWTAFQRADIESFIVKFKDDIFYLRRVSSILECVKRIHLNL